MDGIVPRISRHAKERLRRRCRSCNDAKLKTRMLVILNLLAGRGVTEVARVCHVARATVYTVAQRFRDAGEAGLVDRREENGERKLDESYLGQLYQIVASSPQEHGWKRPTWTREMLIESMRHETGVKIHPATMSRALKKIGARRGRPKPTVKCPWSAAAKLRRLQAIKRLIKSLPRGELAFWEDEVDVHLNPKIGLDWMVRGQQKEVVTPGKNEKRYLAGAKNVQTGELVWVEGERKTSLLFLLLLDRLVKQYPKAKVIHVILDNYSIHHTKQVQAALRTEQGRRIKLHFLPPYCPDENKIERTWQDLHANVTRNHRCSNMQELMCQVRGWLRRRKAA
jgi:transposase